MISLKKIIDIYKKERKSIEYVFEVFLKDSEYYEFYYNKYISYLDIKNRIEDIISSRKSLNSYIRSLSFEQTVGFVYYILNTYPNIKFYRTNHHNDFVLEAFGLIKLRDKNLINYFEAIKKIQNLEDFDPPEIDNIGKYNSLPYYCIIYSNDFILSNFIDRENSYYHSGVSLNYYLWEEGKYDYFIDNLNNQSILAPQYNYVKDDEFDLIYYICLDNILLINPEKILINNLKEDYISRFLRFSPNEIIQRDIAEILNSLEQLKLLILFNKLDLIPIYNSTLNLLDRIGFDIEKVKYF